MSQSDQDQIQDLQIRISFLEQNLDDFNNIVTDQQAQLSMLERAVKHLGSRLEQVGGPDIKSAHDEALPPHY
ncbi:MAG: SlyX protein [Crocinitomicaceae bacterium]|jgi:SlyX protein